MVEGHAFGTPRHARGIWLTGAGEGSDSPGGHGTHLALVAAAIAVPVVPEREAAQFLPAQDAVAIIIQRAQGIDASRKVTRATREVLPARGSVWMRTIWDLRLRTGAIAGSLDLNFAQSQRGFCGIEEQV